MPEIRMPAALTMLGLLGGVLTGLILTGSDRGAGVLAVLEPVGTLWLNALQATIVPLVAALLVGGVLQMARAAGGGRKALLTLGTFLLLLLGGTLLAAFATPALLTAFPIPAAAAAGLAEQMGALDPGPVPTLAELFGSLVPTNVINAAAQTAMLPLVLFFAIFALAMTRLVPAQRDLLAGFFAALANVMLVMIGWVLRLAPIGVFALGAALGARTGIAALGLVAHYVAMLLAIGTAILAAAYVLAVFGARLDLLRFAKAMLPAQTVALSTQSSLASLPPMLGAAQNLGVRERDCEFVLPMAVAIFRSTGPAMNLAVVIYVAALANVPLTPAVMTVGIAVAMLTTLGSVSLPGAISFVAAIGPIALAMGVPIAPLALLVAVEVIPDLMRTLANVTMNVAVAATIGRRTSGLID
ncbi:cation:dicarboxylase symporter family transporter [Croceicoccus sp. F390]|uniref:Cation:dicarboxylase symporter family transporter n=1 Tax=Croceicoccus esteveae TaxID=3075597 RepID=A0ABU2ZK83_9SPHN|nr:cation:dicarboxylase symporter family transporter [Croceicoccus sp. F390]MDT0577015.1 cation:dicarboxylase symporter family transporter [Croceicoccus sp. F390]